MSDPEKLKELDELFQLVDKVKTYNRLLVFRPYPKQMAFLELGRTKRERLLMAANRVGKTETGAFEAACHLTGIYPAWWRGRVFDHPIMMWAAGETSVAVRDVCQEKLCGAPGVESAWGTGLIPKEMLLEKSLARGVTDAYDTVQVRHKSGGVSRVTFKSYEQGREKFQASGLDVMWFDEEPPIPIYLEGLTRIGDRGGLCYMTFTPLKGPTATVLRYTDEPSPDRAVVSMTLDDVPDSGHLSAQKKKEMLDSMAPHEREARSKGIPMLGSGRIFTAPEDSVLEEPIPVDRIPPYWFKLWGVDFGIDHPFGAVLILWDKDADVIHVHHCYRVKDAMPIQHADAMKRVAASVPAAWPIDGNIRRDDGKPMADHYRRHGVRMLSTHATWPDGSVSTEAGLLEIDEREKGGRIKYAKTLTDFLEERRLYHRKDGQIVKFKDDLISALRVAVMAKRFAKQVPLGPGVVIRADAPRSRFASGAAGHPDGEMNPWTGM